MSHGRSALPCPARGNQRAGIDIARRDHSGERRFDAFVFLQRNDSIQIRLRLAHVVFACANVGLLRVYQCIGGLVIGFLGIRVLPRDSAAGDQIVYSARR